MVPGPTLPWLDGLARVGRSLEDPLMLEPVVIPEPLPEPVVMPESVMPEPLLLFFMWEPEAPGPTLPWLDAPEVGWL